MPEPILRTLELTKTYGSFRALDACSLSVSEGEIFGLLGPNGAGKTTLIRLLLGYLKPTSGSAKIGGYDCISQSLAVRAMTSYLPGDARLFPTMNGREALAFFAEIRTGGDYRRSLEFAERLELDLSRRIGFMSTGMRQKLALAAVLAAPTKLVILDEPTSNLDPNVRSTVVNLVLEAKRNGRTIVFSSHVMSEVEETCDHVAILRRGKVVHLQAMPELRRRHRVLAEMRGDWQSPPAEIAPAIEMLRRSDSEFTLETAGDLAPLLGWLATLPLAELRVEAIGLRSIYDRYHSEGAEN